MPDSLSNPTKDSILKELLSTLVDRLEFYAKLNLHMDKI